MIRYFFLLVCVCASSVVLPDSHYTIDCPASYGRELLSSSCLGYVPADKVDAWFSVMNSWRRIGEALTLRQFGLPDLWNRKVYLEIESIVQDGESVLYIMTLLTSQASPQDWAQRVRSFIKDPEWREKRTYWIAELKGILGDAMVDAIFTKQRTQTSNPLLSAEEN